MTVLLILGNYKQPDDHEYAEEQMELPWGRVRVQQPHSEMGEFADLFQEEITILLKDALASKDKEISNRNIAHNKNHETCLEIQDPRRICDRHGLALDATTPLVMSSLMVMGLGNEPNLI